LSKNKISIAKLHQNIETEYILRIQGFRESFYSSSVEKYEIEKGSGKLMKRP
jgi:hypothetical protein